MMKTVKVNGKKMNFYSRIVKVDDKKIEVFRINNCINGQPRYVVHFLDLDIKLKDYKLLPFTKYRAKWFGGGYVFQSFHLEEDLQFMLETVQAFYNKQVQKTV